MRIFLGIALLAFVACVSGCQRPVPTADPAVLRFGAIPDQTPELVLAQHKALMERLCAVVRKRCEWVVSASYEALVDSLGRGEVDVAYLGAATFAQAWHRHQAVPLAMRDIDFRFTSVIVVAKDSSVRGLDDLRNLRFRFGNRRSTSGHFMLRQRLRDRGIVPEQYFAQVAYGANHQETLRAVAAGEADAGGLNADVYYRRVKAGDPSALALRVIWQTPPFTDYVWAARGQISDELRQALTDAFLDLDLGSHLDAPALRAEGAAGFVPAYRSDFDEVREVLQSQDQL